jgi:uncharacterized protein
MTAQGKLQTLETDLARMPRVLVCFSGGVDSAFLLRVAVDVLGPRVTAFTAISPSIALEEIAGARPRERPVCGAHWPTQA